MVMEYPLDIAVIADDLTGAADTGVQFCPVVGPVYLTGNIDEDVPFKRTETRGLSIYTNSRHLGASIAGEIVGSLAKEIQRLTPGLLYKKIDSCLRGNIGAEIDALLEATSTSVCFVAPAFPEQGRTTENNIHKVNGIPVAETEIGRDPLTPVTESRLSHLLSGQSRFSVGHVDLLCIEKGARDMTSRVKELLAKGCRSIVFDAVKDSHLDKIVELALGYLGRDKILLAGSAGLAASVVRYMGQGVEQNFKPVRPRIEKWLFVCGSASQVMAEQVAHLEYQSGLYHEAMEAFLLVEKLTNSATGSEQLESKLIDTWSDSSLILSIKPLQNITGSSANPERVIAGLAKTAEALINSDSPQGLFLSGGDTAEAVLHRLDAGGILLHEEILPGLMLGEIACGPFKGLPVVTKAGAFGNADTLNQLINIVK